MFLNLVSCYLIMGMLNLSLFQMRILDPKNCIKFELCDVIEGVFNCALFGTVKRHSHYAHQRALNVHICRRVSTCGDAC